MMWSTPPRPLKVEPVETTVKSSKDSQPQQRDGTRPARKFNPTPIESSTKSHRNFTPEPIETSIKSSKDKETRPPARSFKPELVETTAASSREKFAQQWEGTTTRRRFKPEPVETTVRSSRKKFAEEWGNTTAEFPASTSPKSERRPAFPAPTSSKSGRRPPRRFAPLLIETAQRSRKAGDATPAVLPSDKTEARQRDYSRSPTKTRGKWSPPPPPDNTPTVDATQNPLFLEVQQRATSPGCMRRPSWASMRSHHSFRVPDLDPIESSESEASTPPSPSTSPSPNSDDHSYMYTEATRMRESVDDRFSGYLLDLAAKAAEKQLREQAMAAFPNDDHHEPVDHFIGRDSSDEAELQRDGAQQRRESAVPENNPQLREMQLHREKLERQQREEKEKKKRREAEMNKPERQSNSPWASAAALKNIVGGYQKDSELNCMRKGARPPMLGGDIKFPRCSSPEPSRFDTTQGCDATRIAMCYLTEQSHQAEKGQSLWCGSKKPTDRPSFYSNPSNAPSRTPSRAPSAGLWGGSCVNTGNTPPRGPTGLLTPMIEIDNPMSPCPTPARSSIMPPTPPPSNTDFATIDEKLAAQAAIEEDFGDDFITQVYNYLSLGYPSIARMFDEELSRISKFSISDLRQDDHLPSTRGYIRLGEDGYLADTEITEETCMRWRALRVYIREWAKQQPNMATETGAGVAVRKGSWAF